MMEVFNRSEEQDWINELEDRADKHILNNTIWIETRKIRNQEEILRNFQTT